MSLLSRYFTIGMAGHIDHGKTTLTKALTGVDTDHLKEEKERNISIEPGFAPFLDEKDLEVSIVDVPGHEHFIRQMIAGVAGIDMVLLVIAADEGMMPQTKEHVNILSLLGITDGFIILTKVDKTEDDLLELVLEDVRDNMKQTFLHQAPIFMVDSMTGKGISPLKHAIREKLLKMPKKKTHKPFRLPIDHVFTVKGQGVVVRGTIYDGEVRVGDRLTVLPVQKEVRVRQIQRHQMPKEVAYKGQRTALNLGGISRAELMRGDVLVKDDYFSNSKKIDVVFQALPDIQHHIKQRQPIKLHIGTAEVMGRIVFFDRNEINENETAEVLCQIQLSEAVVVTRRDRFIVRRPTPAETIGGGWIIDPEGKKYRFGNETIRQLQQKKEGTPKDRLYSFLEERMVATSVEMIQHMAVSAEVMEGLQQDLIKVGTDMYTLPTTLKEITEKLRTTIETFHRKFPMRTGVDKASLISGVKYYPAPLVEFALLELEKMQVIQVDQHILSMATFIPTLPSEWKTRLEGLEHDLTAQGIEVEKWDDLVRASQIPESLQKDFYYYLLETNKAYLLDEERLVTKVAADEACIKLREGTNRQAFTLQTARDVLQLTRKNLVPLLELFDQLGYTTRDGNVREWKK